jgi:hypothetical protein
VHGADHYGEFKLSITKALADQLSSALKKLKPTALTSGALDLLPHRPGVYQLYLDGRRVYVGKASKSLPTRLRKHHRKLSGRPIPGAISFVCLYLDEDLEASAPEKMLLGKYEGKYEPAEGEQMEKLAWNNNGFGNNDPGRRRDASEVESNHFDALYPIDLELVVDWLTPGIRPIGKVLSELKKGLPYNLRFESIKNSERARHDYKVTLVVPSEPMAAHEVLSQIVAGLPPGWQATALPGYLILYFEANTYNSALCWWRRVADDVIETAGPGIFAPPAEITEVGENEGDGEDG